MGGGGGDKVFMLMVCYGKETEMATRWVIVEYSGDAAAALDQIFDSADAAIKAGQARGYSGARELPSGAVLMDSDREDRYMIASVLGMG